MIFMVKGLPATIKIKCFIEKVFNFGNGIQAKDFVILHLCYLINPKDGLCQSGANLPQFRRSDFCGRFFSGRSELLETCFLLLI